ncbi:Replication protein A DNA-binding subunit B [Glycine max]|nr:Replication protein A DNA-binding subunit B [Glycine max]
MFGLGLVVLLLFCSGAIFIVMARSPDKIKSIDGSKETLKLSVRISDLWFIGTPNKYEQAEMVFVDSDGDEIHAVCKQDQLKVCDHQFKLVFIGVTVVRECVLGDIPFRKYRFAGFADVVAGQFERGLLMLLVLWRRLPFGKFQEKFLKFLDDYKGDGPITVLLSHCRIKEAQGSYLASISNSFKASKLIINQPVMEIQEFNERLAELGIEARSGFKSHGEGSTQLSGSIQLSSKESFFGKAEAKTIVEINTISEEIVCVTVGTITRIVLDNHSWCYTACIQCHKKSDTKMAPFTCACDKYNKEVVLRYRLEVMINQGNESTKFLLWDRECSELIGQSADAVNKLKIEDGDVDLNVSPQALDKLLGHELAFKIKVQPKFRNFVVLKCSADSSLINAVMDMLANAETSSKMDIPVSGSNLLLNMNLRSDDKKRKRNRLTMREWFSYRLQCRSNESMTLLNSRRLFQQFVVDGYTMVESERLSYIRNNQKKLRVDKFCSLQQSLDDGSRRGLNKGKRVILPSTFVGNPRYMDQLYFDGMAICSHVGFPNLLITLTCNPNWPEIHRFLNPLNLKAADRLDLISRVFKLKYEQMLMDLTKNHMLGKVIAYETDQIISAEIPSRQDDRELYSLVKNHMVHGPCGSLNPGSPCMKKGKCSRFYPKMFQSHTVLDANGFPVYHRRNNGNAIEKNGVIVDNRYIVPYNPRLLRKYQAHINIEWCNQNTSIKYLFKYVNKGYDRVTAVLIDEDNDQTENGGTHNDEIKEYLDCRYICPCESTWRIFGFPIHGRKPAVERLHFHLPGQHSVLYEDHDDIDDVLSKPSISYSKFISWMNTNQNSVEGRNLTYAEFVSKFVYNQKKRCWHLRKKGYTIGRLLWVPPITGELFYLRMMLTVCKGPTSFEDLRKVDNVQYSTYKEACFAMRFLQDDKEFIEAIKEAKDWGSAHYIRKLFVLLLLTATMSKPEQVWDQTWHWMADDIVYNYKKSSTSPALQLDDRTLQNLVLLEIEQLLQANQRSLRDYPSMPYPEDANCPAYLDNSLILAELNYNNEELRSEFEHLFSHMTDEQASIYNQIVEAVNKDEGGMFFLYGYGDPASHSKRQPL